MKLEHAGLSDQDILEFAQSAMQAESDAVVSAAQKLSVTFVAAVRALIAIRGKVVITGLGKSGHVGRKIASTLASTGTPAFFLHPSEALHGDLGMVTSDDAVIGIAFGGETIEVLEVVKHARRVGCNVIAITGKIESSLAKLAHFTLDGSISREVCPLNLAPTASTAVALALGDALAMCLMKQRGFTSQDFAVLHPGGSIGRRLSCVGDHMRATGVDLPTVSETQDFHIVLEAVTRKNFGIVPVLDPKGQLVGAISDGDIRRSLLHKGAKALSLTAKEIMTPNPRTVASTMIALEAFQIMEKHQITSLFVVDDSTTKVLQGIVRMHDLLAAKIV